MDNLPDPDWPDEVKKAYEHLKIPTLYEALLANEKLSAEVRRQYKEIKLLNENIAKLNLQMGEAMSLIVGAAAEGEEDENEEEEFEEIEEEFEPGEIGEYEIALFEERQERILRETRNALLEAVDAILDLSKNAHTTLSSLKTPSGRWFSFSSDETSDVADLMIDHINAVQYKLLGQLDELHIQLIEPREGDTFIPQKHRILDRTGGGKKGTIANVIRVGYIQDNVILRCADVVIYS